MIMASLTIQRRFAAPCARVYAALIDNDLTRRTFFAAGMSECAVERDVRVGGPWRIQARMGDMALSSQGVYLEVVPDRRLSYTFAMPQFSPNTDRIAIDLAADEDGCALTFAHDGPDIAAELAQLATGEVGQTERGWRQMLDAIDAALRDG